MSTRVDKPWGYEIIWAKTDDYVGKLLHINSGQRLSKQYHQVKEETIYVLRGVLYNYDEAGKKHRLVSGESFHVSPGQIHRFEAWGIAPTELMEVSTNHLEDVVRLEDDYDRE